MNKLISASLVATSLVMAAGCGTSPNTASTDNYNYVTSSERGSAWMPTTTVVPCLAVASRAA